jgi:hypothetical protein
MKVLVGQGYASRYATIGDDASMESPYAMHHFMIVRCRMIPDDAVLKTGQRRKSLVGSNPRPASLYILPTFWRRQKLRTKCNVLSAPSAPERIGSRRIRPIRRSFSPCEIKTVRFSGLNERWAAFAPRSPLQEIKSLAGIASLPSRILVTRPVGKVPLLFFVS